MTEDATFDVFGGDGTDSESDEESGGVDATPVTSSWSEASACESCGGEADRRWLDDGERVCAACKRWS